MALWDQLGTSGNVDDRRGMGGIGLGLGGGLVGIVMFLALSYMGVQVDPALLEQVAGNLGGSSQSTEQPAEFQGKDNYETFVSTVLGSNNDYWRKTLKAEGKTYPDPTLVLFRDGTRSGCGIATTQVGPHYCPLDTTIYLDETFFAVLQQLGGSNGDVAQAYVIAHEAGHHAQNVLGIMDKAQNDPAYARSGDNSVSVRLELQADCFAGLWANSLRDRNVFQPGDIEQAISAAEAVGDDRIQASTQGSINPETWTHGSSKERVEAFRKGFDTGKLSVCREYM
ncbi:MAG: neutral zinc metallopeptidase [Candidatus Saccharimonadales bacterium]